MLRFLTFLLCAAAAQAAVVLSIDVNDALDTPNDTAPGFQPYTLNDDTLNVPPYTIDVNAASGAFLDDLHRSTPATGGALTLGALYRDSVFAAGDNTLNFYRVGLDAVIGGLTAGKKYTLTVWSYDSGSAGARTSDWSVLGLGGPQFAANNYTFDGGTLPTSDTANRFSVTAYAAANGTLTLRGRPAAQTATSSVFLNGFTIDELPPAALSPTVVLAVDFNDRGGAGAGNTFGGFNEFLLSGAEGTTPTATTRTFGPHSVALAAVGTTLDDRLRATPMNAGAFTEALIARDFVFANTTGGLDATVSGLTPGATYLVELWSFDSTSSGSVRTSDWTVNGGILWDDYGFNGANLPVTNDDCKMAGVFAANGSGQLVISGRLAVNSPAVFLNALRISLLAPPAIVDFGRPIISEFMAENSSGITDEDGETSDWIEIWNTTAGTLNLAGWTLTDNPLLPAKWTFPAGVTLPAQGLLRVWATGKNRTANPAALHTNFALNKASGSHLALRAPDGTGATVFSNLPAQRANVSYGSFGDTEPQAVGYFSPATPGAVNSAPPVPGFVGDTNFSVKRGFYTTPQTVQVTCATPGASIHYTLDGSEPTTASPVVPVSGVNITTTTVLRARAFAPPLAPSNTDTQTYLFNAHVQNQPAAPAGWPATWGIDSEVDANDGAGNGTVPADYAMDPNVVNATLPGYSVADALNALPALSITLEPAGFHSVGTGIYTNPKNTGLAWERACSFEWLNPDGTAFHSNCGIRVHGNSSRRPFRMQKHSFRLAFRSEYGDGRLDAKLFSNSKVKSFDRLVLHAFFTDGWGLVSWDVGRYRPHTALSFRDAFVKDTFAAMGHARVSVQHVHLYINGLYWGLYGVGERVDDAWCADHFGGQKTDWDVIAPDTTTAVQLKDGNLTAWNALFALVNTPDLTVPANYNAVAAQMDLANFVDYYLLHIHADAEDWPHHNGYAVRNRSLPGAKWQFVPWDQEIAFDPLVLVNRYSPGAANTTGNGNAPLTFGVLFQKLRANSEFRLLFADRVHKHLNNGGALSLAAMQARWQAHADRLDRAIVAESARWGDTADTTPYGNTANATLRRETHWLPQVATVKNSHFPMLHNPANSNSTVAELRSQSPRLYPDTEPPVFSQFGGNVPANYALSMTAPTAGSTIYYTTDGTDPRTAYTGAVAGTTYTGPVTLATTALVKARARSSGGEWSALTEATFIVGTAAAAGNLAITELHYNPPLSEDHEFIELMNYSASVIDLTGVSLHGVTFTFPTGTLLAAGQRVLVVRNQAAFTSQYGPGLNVAGEYAGALDNSGEQIAAIAANGADIVRFTYNDKAPWPTAPDGAGRSLVLRAPPLDPTIPFHWRSSVASGGNPGTSDSVTFSGTPLADEDQDGLNALLEFYLGGSDTMPNDLPRPALAVEAFDLGAGPQDYLTITARQNLAADGATLVAQFSTDLATWTNAVVYLGESIDAQGMVTRRWRAAAPRSADPRQFLRIHVTQP